MTPRFDPADLPKNPDLNFESRLWQAGILLVAGLDEAGRGAWAGPVTAAAVILRVDESILQRLSGVRDSKQMSPSQREYWADVIRLEALAWGVGFASQQEIDQMGILPSTRLAMQRSLDALSNAPEHLLIDALVLRENQLPQTSLIKGDSRSLSIAAASVLAKTARDAVMRAEDLNWPGYGFARHKGYGTAIHQAAIKKLGPCPLHRMSFRPLHPVVAEE
ncbi:MAG: ribonuclease HII [Anaerolineaceae bacterium]|nr:ribonuclease HII [Anaerolineaceae bacterium]